MRRHHEELAAASSIWPALSLLVPFTAALWARVKSVRKAALQNSEPTKCGGDL
jgi:hypothetical protein